MRDAPESKEENKLGSITTRFVLVPLDLVQKYWNRAKYKCMEVPDGNDIAREKVVDHGQCVQPYVFLDRD